MTNFESLYISILISLIISLIFLLLLRKLPKILAKSRAEQIESDLPIALRIIASQLKMNIPFEECLKSVSKGYNCSEEFEKVIKDIERGMSVQEALTGMSERIDSKIIKKVVLQLIVAYEEGTGEEIKKLADSLILEQKTKQKEFTSRASIISLFYVGISCIVPILFLTYLLVSSIFLEGKIEIEQIKITFLFIFPATICVMVAFLIKKTPKSIFGEEKFISKKEIGLIDKELRKYNLDPKVFFICLFLFSLILFSFLFVYFDLGIYSFFSFSIPIVVYFFIAFLIDRRGKEIEENLSSALFQAAVHEKGTPIEKIIKDISKSSYGNLSKEFSIANKQIERCADVVIALKEISERNNSKILEIVIELLVKCYRVGKDIQLTIREMAEDIFEIESMLKERSAALSLQKYTILGGCVLLPIILGITINLVSGLEFPTSKITKEQMFEFFSVVKENCGIYIIAYVLFSSILISIQEGKKKNFIIYFMIFSIISSSLYYFVILNVKV
jgi:Flp pilus assembly protein TadB